jgi:hypothetical protein
MDAFADARRHFTAYREMTRAVRERFAYQVGAVVDGVDYWGMFATFLGERFAAVPGVARLTNRHPLAHHWAIGDITVQLKSDTGNLPLDQLTLTGVNESASDGSPETVILTWDHDHSERYAPAFVQLDGKQEAWRLPITALVAEPTIAVPAMPRKAMLTSTRPDIATGGDAAAEQS